MPRALNVDAEFFRVVHNLLETETPDAVSNRRRRPRFLYDHVQRIAPRTGDALPTAAEYFAVRCHDLNEGGFSFLLPEPPTFRELVAVLGRHPEEIFMAATVRHWSFVTVHADGHIVWQGESPAESPRGRPDGSVTMVQVGCRFSARLFPPTTTP